MNIKIIFISVCVMLSLLAVCGCTGYLDEEHPSDVTVDYLFSTPDGLKSAVTGLYTIDRTQISESESNNFALIMGDCGTDIDFDRGCIPDMGRYRPKDLSTQAVVRSWWRKWYRVIERTNSIIYYGEKLNIDPDKKKEILREAYVYRAYALFWLVRKYDNIWLNLEPTTPSNIDGRVFVPASQEDVYKVIVEDLTTAISYYGDDWAVTPGRFNQGVARLLKADVALWMKNYQEAADQATTIINKGIFQLENPENIFTKDRRNKTKEAMFVIQFDEFAQGGGSSHQMARQFVANIQTIPGVMAVSENGGYGWNRIFPNPYLISLYDSKYDKRWDAWWKHYYTYNDPNYDFTGLSYKYGDTLQYGQNSNLIGVNFYNKASISCKKYFDWVKLPTQGSSYNNIYIFRYPQVLLIAAEAYMRLNDQSKALSYVNQIRRNRISANAPDQLLTNLTENILLDEYARELAFEGHRWFLLKRVGKLVERVQLYGGITVFRGIPSPDPDYGASRVNIKPHHIRWPIPNAEIDAMGGFPQNEGY
jgi:hypothetical protein